MRRSILVAAGVVVVVAALATWRPWDAGRGRELPDSEPPAAPSLDLESGPARLTVVQRHSADVPGSGGRLQIHLGDITRRQVEVTLSRADGGGVLPPTSMRQGETIRFAYERHAYRLRILRLENLLLGDDTAELEFSADDALPADPRAQIERLIAEVRAADVVFIRNGVEHDPSAAADHLERKRRAAGDEVRTPEDFIRVCGSRSSLTGKPYEVRLRDGTVLPSQEWLSSLLEDLRVAMR